MAPLGLLGTVLAHQGGWDEILLVLTPIALFAALLWLANSRASRIQDERSSGAAEAVPAAPADDPSAGAGTPGDDPSAGAGTPDDERTDRDPPPDDGPG